MCGAGTAVSSVDWNPNPDLPLLVMASGSRVVVAVALAEDLTDALRELLHSMMAPVSDVTAGAEEEAQSKKPLLARWLPRSLPLQAMADDAKWDAAEAKARGDAQDAPEPDPLLDGLLAEGSVLCVETQRTVKMAAWHAKGDYFTSCDSAGTASSVLIHRLSQQQSLAPFSKTKGEVQAVLFHPSKPMFFVATKRNVRVYNMLKQEMTKKLLFGGKWISSLSLHASGDHLLCGSYDCRVAWFDLDLSSKPYKTVKLVSSVLIALCVTCSP